MCCKRRVLEFDEFLKIEGCKKGRHLFVPKKLEEKVRGNAVLLLVFHVSLTRFSLIMQEEVVSNCRIDHYQTPQNVNVSVFAKQTDKEKSVVKFEEEQVMEHNVLYLSHVLILLGR